MATPAAAAGDGLETNGWPNSRARLYTQEEARIRLINAVFVDERDDARGCGQGASNRTIAAAAVSRCRPAHPVRSCPVDCRSPRQPQRRARFIDTAGGSRRRCQEWWREAVLRLTIIVRLEHKRHELRARDWGCRMKVAARGLRDCDQPRPSARSPSRTGCRGRRWGTGWPRPPRCRWNRRWPRDRRR